MRREGKIGKGPPAAPARSEIAGYHIARIGPSRIPKPIRNQKMVKTHNSAETPAAETYAAPARDSDGRGREHSASDPQGRRYQRPEAFRPSSVRLGSLVGHLAQKPQDASAVPYQAQGVQHSDVERPLDDGPGAFRAGECLDGRQTVAPSSLRAKPSRTSDFVGKRLRRRQGGDRRNGRLKAVRQGSDDSPLLAFRSGRSGDVGSSKRERLKHRSGPHPVSPVSPQFRPRSPTAQDVSLVGGVGL